MTLSDHLFGQPTKSAELLAAEQRRAEKFGQFLADLGKPKSNVIPFKRRES